jgi:hypothetical protein
MAKLRAMVFSNEKVKPPRDIHAMPRTGAGRRSKRRELWRRARVKYRCSEGGTNLDTPSL